MMTELIKCYWCGAQFERMPKEKTDGEGHDLCDNCYSAGQSEVDSDFGATGVALILFIMLALLMIVSGMVFAQKVYIKTCPFCQNCVPVAFTHSGSTWPYVGYTQEEYSCREEWEYVPFGDDSLLSCKTSTPSKSFWWSQSDSVGALIWVRYSDSDTSKISRWEFNNLFTEGLRSRP